VASTGSRFRTVEAGSPVAPVRRLPARPRQAANDNRAPLFKRLLLPLIGLAGLASAAAALYTYFA
jgi:hypothetical protein